MENNVPEVPNSPQELFAMQRKCSCEKDDPQAFAEYLSEVALPEEDPSPYQTVKAIEMMLYRLRNYHFDVLHEDESLTAFQKKLWEDDYQHLEKALKHIRLVSPD